MRHIETAIPKKTLEDLLAVHLYATSIANDGEEVKFVFKNEYLQNIINIPMTIELIKKERKEEIGT